ncbi:putative late blight resistance protein homolog R1B-17 [Coffea eugenioides]|nr:putative late blight resistance protein homolog R1B-17 [Coffea eugenioides]
MAYKIEFLIDSSLVGDIPHSSSMSLDSILEQIEIIKAEAMKIIDTERHDVKGKDVTQRVNDMPSRINDVVVGLEDEAKSIIERLTRGSSQVQIIHIVGMAGLGKTTLAKKVYCHPSVTSHFHARAWCTISQVYHQKRLLLEILTCIEPEHSDEFLEKCETDLVLILKQKLGKKRYLIVLDDVWDIEAWNALKDSFPENKDGNAVIITSRIRGVAPQDKSVKELPLRQLTHDESWRLLKQKLCPRNYLLLPKLCELRMQIGEKCQGLPLTIVILAGILSNIGQDGWEDVVESLSAHTVSTTDQCTATLELSYDHLPDRLKPCFLYLGAFPEDQEYTPKSLIQLWVAEGFVRKSQIKSSEDVANDYMMDLTGRSLIMVSKTSSIGGVKACRVHDLLHEFCLTKAKGDNFFQLVRRYNELYTLHIPHYLRRLCIYSEPEHIRESRLFSPTIRSLLFFAHGKTNQEKSFHEKKWFDHSFIFHAFKLVRVLDLSQIHLGFTFPREIELLVLLRYLAVMVDMLSIPSSIANLLNWETFIVRSGMSISLPDTIWNLKKLRHLHIDGFDWPIDNLDNSSNLCNLVSFSGAIPGQVIQNVSKYPQDEMPNFEC